MKNCEEWGVNFKKGDGEAYFSKRPNLAGPAWTMSSNLGRAPRRGERGRWLNGQASKRALIDANNKADTDPSLLLPSRPNNNNDSFDDGGQPPRRRKSGGGPSLTRKTTQELQRRMQELQHPVDHVNVMDLRDDASGMKRQSLVGLTLDVNDLASLEHFDVDKAVATESETTDEETPDNTISVMEEVEEGMKRDPGIPDEWVFRHENIIRLSGRHPFNAEPGLQNLMGRDGKGQFITSNAYHFVRNHGPVPQITWEDHTLTIQLEAASAASININANANSDATLTPLTLTMEELEAMPYQELPVTVTCTGNRRSEQNAIKRTIGFSWGQSATGTCLYRGVPLRQLLQQAGISSDPEDWQGCHVEFVGSDELPNKVGEGPFPDKPWGDKLNYCTSIPLGKAMDPARDIMVVYLMNGERLPPDHGFPIRSLVPGSTGGRCVKWLRQINVLPHESHELYHYHDNKILPPIVQSLEQSKQEDWWYRPEYIVNEININSVISRPGHGDTLKVEILEDNNKEVSSEEEGKKGDGEKKKKKEEEELFELAGYAYAGGGRKVTRVEISLDEGATWNNTELKRHNEPTAHDMHWCWIFWSDKRPTTDFLVCEEVWVRAWDETNNTQPLLFTWNLMGLGNNCVFRVKVHKESRGINKDGNQMIQLRFEHPTQPGAIPGGWMKEEGGLPRSAGYGLLEQTEPADDKANGGPPTGGKIVSQEELACHNKEDDVWIAVDGRVYDCSNYLQLHPGGKESILVYGGKDCTVDFDAVHSEGAKKLLFNYYIGELEGGIQKPTQSDFDDEIQKILDKIEEDEEAEKFDPKLASQSTTHCMELLNERYGFRKAEDSIAPSDAVVIDDWWMKTKLMNLHGFSEALLKRWRLLVAIDRLKEEEENQAGADEGWMECRAQAAHINRKAVMLMTKNQDPLAENMGRGRLLVKKVLQCTLETAVLELNIGHEHCLYNEEEFKSFGILDKSVEECAKVFIRYYVSPKQWLSFVEAFLWAVSTHSHFAQKNSDGELTNKASFAAFASHSIARFMIRCTDSLRGEFKTAPYLLIRNVAASLQKMELMELRELFGDPFYKLLFANHPGIKDYFLKTDMIQQSRHAVEALLLILQTGCALMANDDSWRRRMNFLDELHASLQIPTMAFRLWAGTLLQLLEPVFQKESQKSANGRFAATLEELENAFAYMTFECVHECTVGMLHLEQIEAQREHFLTMLSIEHKWPQDKTKTRLLESRMELSSGSSVGYVQTSEEVEEGVRIAWRNSSDKHLRSFWDKLQVLDRRNVNTYKGIAKAMDEHLKAAAANNYQKPVVVVFGAKDTEELWGTRCWNFEYFSYAGYCSAADGKLMGDPANAEYTNFLMKFRLWSPPSEKSNFDLLPVVFKMQGVGPYAYNIPSELRAEVPIEHPEYEEFSSIGLKWPASKFQTLKIVVGGIEYQCCAFNEPCMSREIVESLCDRPGITAAIAKIIGASPDQPLSAKRIQFELELAVIHSYAKHKYPLIDEEARTVTFSTFVEDERMAGRKIIHDAAAYGVDPRMEWNCNSLKVVIATDEAQSDIGIQQKEKQLTEMNHLDAKLLILYGSETGNSEFTARRLKKELKLLRPTMMDLNGATGLDVVKGGGFTHVLAICSTFGRGDFPHNAKKFGDTDLAAGAMSGVKFAVLGLGSTIYPDFCAAAIKVQAKLQLAGGKCSHPLTKIDCSSEMEGPIRDWIQMITKSVLPASVAAELGKGSEGATVEYKMNWSKEHVPSRVVGPLFAWPSNEDGLMLCVHNEELTGKDGDPSRSIRKITFALPPGVTYETGDHLSVQPVNSEEAVKRFANCFKLEILGGDDKGNEAKLMHHLHVPFSIVSLEDQVVTEFQPWFSTPTTLAELLSTQVEFLLSDAQVDGFLELVWQSITDSKDKLSNECSDLLSELEGLCTQASSLEGDEKKMFKNSFLSQFPTFIDFFEHFHFLPSPLGLATVLTHAGRLQARSYSISSSSEVHRTAVSITVGVVRFVTGAGVHVRGTCSNYLASLTPGECLGKMSIRTSDFRGPPVPTTPVIMVGPGTGLAPMMGFLEDRARKIAQMDDEQQPDNNCHLFFGCRDHGDRIYADKLALWETTGGLTVHLALSRSKGVPKKYVTHLMKEMEETLYLLLKDPTLNVYICGDAKVANDVSDLCLEVMRRCGRMTRVRAAEKLRMMKLQNRWQTDLWGTPKGLEGVGAIGIPTKTSNKKRATLAWFKSVV